MVTEFFCEEALLEISERPESSALRMIADRNLPAGVDPNNPTVRDIIRRCQGIVRERNKERTSRGVL